MQALGKVTFGYRDMNINKKLIGNSVYFSHLNEGKAFYEGRIDWCKKDVEITLCLENGLIQENLKVAEILWEHQQKWNSSIEDIILKKVWGKTWVEDEGEIISSEDFLKRIGLVSINIEEAEFNFLYHDGGLYYGHAIQVTGNTKEGPKYADAPI
jgi:hypothetical protein